LLEWKKLIDKINNSEGLINIGLVAKYVGSNDPYISVVEAIKAATFHLDKNVNVQVIEAEGLETDAHSKEWQLLKSMDGIVVPGGFDKRGIEGKILAVRYARENKIPYFGLCLGMQVMIIEFARSLLGFSDANSTEFEKETKHPVIALLEEQVGVTRKGGTMRLGVYPCGLKNGTKAYGCYNSDVILERHRHRYEVNNKYRPDFEAKGVVFSGIYKEKDLVEISELIGHPFMLGTQFHPEFTSTPLKSHPLFKAFVEAAIRKQNIK
jgi:CTP synthase